MMICGNAGRERGSRKQSILLVFYVGLLVCSFQICFSYLGIISLKSTSTVIFKSNSDFVTLQLYNGRVVVGG